MHLLGACNISASIRATFERAILQHSSESVVNDLTSLQVCSDDMRPWMTVVRPSCAQEQPKMVPGVSSRYSYVLHVVLSQEHAVIYQFVPSSDGVGGTA